MLNFAVHELIYETLFIKRNTFHLVQLTGNVGGNVGRDICSHDAVESV